MDASQLFSEVFTATSAVFQRVAPVMLGVFLFIAMFLVTSLAMVRERTSGTLERLLTTPEGNADLVLGYGLALRGAGAGAGMCRRRGRAGAARSAGTASAWCWCCSR